MTSTKFRLRQDVPLGHPRCRFGTLESDTQPQFVVSTVPTGSIPEGFCKKKRTLASTSAAESIDHQEGMENWAIAVGVEESSSGAAGKQMVEPNLLNRDYPGVQFWQH